MSPSAEAGGSGTGESMRAVERCLPIAAPRAEVFRALLDPAALSRWMYATVQWKPQKGAAYRIDWQDTNLPAHARGEILEIQEDRRLVLSWFMERDGCETTASFELEDDGAGRTLVKFRHAGFPATPDWQVRFDMVALEWDKVLENLRFHVEEGGGGRSPFYLREQVVLPASRERVYAHWVAPGAVSSWLATRACIDPAAGGEIDLLLPGGRRVRGVFRLFVPGRHLRILWEEEGRRSLLGVSFWPSDHGSTLTVVQRSYAIDESLREEVRAGWRDAFERLERTLSRAPGRWPRSGKRTIALERTVGAPPERAWKAIAEAVGISSWFCDRAEFTARPGMPYAFLWTGWGEQRGEVVNVAPGARLTLSWDVPRAEATTLVDWTLLPAGTERTRIALAHSDWGEGGEWDREYAATKSGWRSALGLLDFYLRRGMRGPRRSFLLRRRLLSVPPQDLWRRFEDPEAFAAWMGPESAIEAREGGSLRARGPDGLPVEGLIEMADAETGVAIAFEGSEPGYVEMSWSGDAGGSDVLVSGIAYGVADSWPLQQRVLWDERLGRIGG